jgi:hypothetical protein
MKSTRVTRTLESLFLATSIAVLAGCAMSPRFEAETPAYTSQKEVKSIYIYSFMDVRETEFGPQYLKEVEQQLGPALEKHGIRSQQLWFKRSPVAKEYSMADTPTAPLRSSKRVPIAEVIRENIPNEKAFGGTHALILFPSSVRATGSGALLTVRWDLYDGETHNLEWSTLSDSNHYNWIKNDEAPKERAALFVEGALQQMKKSGIIK